MKILSADRADLRRSLFPQKLKPTDQTGAERQSYIIFSQSGFTRTLKDMAARHEHLHLASIP